MPLDLGRKTDFTRSFPHIYPDTQSVPLSLEGRKNNREQGL